MRGGVNETYSNVFTFVGLNFRITVISYHVEQKEKSKLSNSQLSRGEEIWFLPLMNLSQSFNFNNRYRRGEIFKSSN